MRVHASVGIFVQLVFQREYQKNDVRYTTKCKDVHNTQVGLLFALLKCYSCHHVQDHMYVPNVCVVVSAHLWFVVCNVGGYECVCVS